MKTVLNGLFLVAVGVVLGVFIMATNPKCAKAAAMTDIHTGGGIDDGTNNGFSLPEMTIPHTNLPSGNQTNLCTWSEGVTASSVTLEAYGANGSLRHSLVIQ